MRMRVMFLAVATALTAPAWAATGPSSSGTPYLEPLSPSVEFTSILTVGDQVKKKNKGNQLYRMVGIPDGLGAYDNGDGTITVLMDHELGATAGLPRAHGGRGAFVSKWQIRKSDLAVLNGEDLIETVKLWDATSQSFVDGFGTAFGRFCSADLAPKTAFYNAVTRKGFDEGRIFLSGEETGAAGRVFAHISAGRQHGTSYELPRLGRISWENAVANSHEQDLTVVAALDDTSGGNVYIYSGEKQDQGSPVELAGLHNGSRYAIAIDGFTSEPAAHGFSGRFSLITGAGTGLNRPEDGAWDPSNPNRLYFVTTDSFTGNSRLWRITFDNIEAPLSGGTIEVAIDGIDYGIHMMDNLTIDNDGKVYIQEDPGNQAYLARIWRYTPGAINPIEAIAQHDSNRFAPGGVNFLTQDEESSGIINVTNLFEGVGGYDTENNRYFLLDVQAHYNVGDAELVEGGQLLMMRVAK